MPTRRIKFKIGDIVSIPLPDGRYAHAQCLRDGTFKIFDAVSTKPLGSGQLSNVGASFFAVCNEQAVRTGEWPIVGHHPVLTEDEAWGAPMATGYLAERQEWAMGTPRINIRGESRDATEEEVEGLDIMSVSHHPDLLVRKIVDRLINGNHEAYRVPRRKR